MSFELCFDLTAFGSLVRTLIFSTYVITRTARPVRFVQGFVKFRVISPAHRLALAAGRRLEGGRTIAGGIAARFLLIFAIGAGACVGRGGEVLDIMHFHSRIA